MSMSHILLENKVLRNLSRVLFYFFTEKRKLAVNIDKDRPNSDYNKFGVTEKSYDFVTFYIKTGNYQMTIQYIHNNLKNRNNITYTISKKNSCMDGLWTPHLIGYTLKGYVTIIRYYHLENALQMSVSDILQKKKKDTKSHNLRIFTILKKTPLNADCDRADSRFTNDTECVKKCNIFNYIDILYNICETQ
ncbi:hypothetical protein C6497_06095 [Candidatus Poribacteria bacterium]|nr:MAG: hypothetical protein C6497_06095 [Candidatus Poribacteria bacterium]